MTVKTSFTESEVGELMQSILGETARQMGWENEDNAFAEAIESTLHVLGEDDFSFVSTRSDAYKVRLVARMEAWRMAMYNTVHEASFSVGSPGTGQTSRSEIYRQSKEQFEMARGELKRLYPSLVADVDLSAMLAATITPIDYESDLYDA